MITHISRYLHCWCLLSNSSYNSAHSLCLFHDSMAQAHLFVFYAVTEQKLLASPLHHTQKVNFVFDRTDKTTQSKFRYFHQHKPNRRSVCRLSLFYQFTRRCDKLCVAIVRTTTTTHSMPMGANGEGIYCRRWQSLFRLDLDIEWRKDGMCNVLSWWWTRIIFSMHKLHFIPFYYSF